MTDWQLSDGPQRPMWEPVRLVDFADKRLDALRALWQRLDESRADWNDEDLAMFAILDYLFKNTVITLESAKMHAQRVAVQNLPDPGPRKRRRISAERRDEIIVVVAVEWGRFISPNFPLAKPPEA